MREDWIEEELGQVLKTTSGGTPSRKNKNFYNGTIPWVKSGELDQGVVISTEETITEAALENSSAKLFPKGTLLIALYGATIGKLAFLGVEAATNQAICGIFSDKKYNSKFLYFFLLKSRSKLISQGTGGAQPNISQTILKKLKLPIPPLPEQRAIVAKIEQLFSELEHGQAQLKKAQEQLKVYKQAVLKKAFEGEFSLKLIDEVCLKIQDGSHFSPKIQHLTRVENSYPYVTSKNIRNGYMIHSNIKYVEKEFHDGIYKRCDPVFGDVLLTKDGANTGNVCLNEFKQPISLLSSVCLIKPNQSILNSKFMLYYIQSPIGFKSITGKMTGTAIKRITLTNLKTALIPIPSLKEQTKIVQEIESRFSVVEQLENNLTAELERSQNLRQSILKQAFEGRLLTEAEIAACKKEKDWKPAEELVREMAT